VKSAEDESKWWVFYEIDMSGWETHRSALAAELTSEEWEAVSQSVTELGKFGTRSRRPRLHPISRTG
jgi:hypothetical protein